MDLDEFKDAWAALDNKLEKNERLNERLVREMLEKKSNKALNRLINFEWFIIAIMVLIIPLIVWLLVQNQFNGTIAPKCMFIFALFHIIFGSLYTGKHVLNLMKFDFTKEIKRNTEIINRFIIKIKKEKQIGFFLIIPIYYILGAISYYELHANVTLWAFLVVMFILGVIGTYLQYDKYYASNIKIIKNSLEELKELEEEED